MLCLFRISRRSSVTRQVPQFFYDSEQPGTALALAHYDFQRFQFGGILFTDNVVHGFWHVVFTSHHESKVEVIRKRFNYKLRSSANSSTFIHRRVHIFFYTQRSLGSDRNYKGQRRMRRSSRSSVQVGEMKECWKDCFSPISVFLTTLQFSSSPFCVFGGVVTFAGRERSAFGFDPIARPAQ